MAVFTKAMANKASGITTGALLVPPGKARKMAVDDRFASQGQTVFIVKDLAKDETMTMLQLPVAADAIRVFVTTKAPTFQIELLASPDGTVESASVIDTLTEVKSSILVLGPIGVAVAVRAKVALVDPVSVYIVVKGG